MLRLLSGGGGVEIRCHGFGPHPALRVHGRVHHRDGGRLRREAHRAQLAVEFNSGRVRAERLTRALREAFAPFRLSAQAFAILESLSCDLDGSYLKFF